MPIINIKFDSDILNNEDILILSNAIQKIVKEITSIDDVCVYADSPKIKVGIAPVEIFVEIGAGLVENKEELILKIKNALSEWKKSSKFNHLINLSLVLMNWKVEIGI